MNDYYLIVTYILGGILGLCVGSFLNVVIYRVPEGMSLASPPSHCPRCKYSLKWYDNIPVLSYIILGGKCRSCKTHISFRYTAVELTNTLLWLLSVYAYAKDNLPYAIICALGCSVLVCIFFIDLEHKIIPDRFQIILGLLGIAAIFFDKNTQWYSHLVGAAAGGTVFGLVAYFGSRKYGKEALGGGDIKLSIVSGLLLGWEKFLVAMLVATVGGSIILLSLRAKKDQAKDTEYPFAPFITAGIAFALFFGDKLIDAYVSLIRSGF